MRGGKHIVFNFWPFNLPNEVPEGSVPLEVTHHIEGGILSGYRWIPNDQPDWSKDHSGDFPLI
jgi:hypothetical protein